MFDNLVPYGMSQIEVLFGGMVYAPKDCNLTWHIESDICYTGKDICGLVSHANNNRSAISVKSEDSNILDITDAPVPEVENISQDTVETEKSTEPESDTPISDALAEESKKQEGGIEDEG